MVPLVSKPEIILLFIMIMYDGPLVFNPENIVVYYDKVGWLVRIL